jgi:hypothetical protein
VLVDPLNLLTLTFLTSRKDIQNWRGLHTGLHSKVLSCLYHTLQSCKPEVALIPVTCSQKYLTPLNNCVQLESVIKYKLGKNLLWSREIYLEVHRSGKVTTVKCTAQLDEFG